MQSQTSNRPKIIAIGLIAVIGIAAIAFLIIIILATRYSTSTDSGNSATETEGKLDSISRQLDALQGTVNLLATETAAANSPKPTSIRQPTPTTRPTSTQAGRANVPTPSPTATATTPVAAMPTGPGICGRSPMIQYILIDRLNLASCQLITVHELFRVSGLRDLEFDNSPQPGDFAGLVNVKELRTQLRNGSDLLADTFHGLEGLEILRVELHGTEEYDGTIEPGAFRGLSSIRTLELSWNRDTDERVSIPPFDHLETLEELYISIPDHLFAPTADHFRNLPHLRSLSIRTEGRYGGVPRALRLTQELFKNNGKLEEIEIQMGSAYSAVHADKDTFLRLEGLKSLSMNTSSDIELSLSPNSPLLKDILNGNQSPQGYTVIPTGAN